MMSTAAVPSPGGAGAHPEPTSRGPNAPASGLAGRPLRFEPGIPGFPGAKTFTPEPWGPQPNPFYVLECQEVSNLRFVVVPPVVFFPGYDPAFGPEVYEALGAKARDELVVLVILTLHSRPEETTANLLGPVVVNAGNGHALQAVLSGSGLSPQAPVVQAQ